jgi:hypothetical protein
MKFMVLEVAIYFINDFISEVAKGVNKLIKTGFNEDFEFFCIGDF